MKIGITNTIDFAKVSSIPIFDVNVKTCDRKRVVSMVLLENNKAIDLTKYTVAVAGKKSDGNDIFNTVTKVDAENGICEVEITEQMLVLGNDLPCEIILYGSDGTVASSSNFIINSVQNVLDAESVVSSSEFTVLNQSLSRISRVEEGLNEVKEHCTGGNAMQEHSHVNKTILDKFSETDGKLYYDNEKIEYEIKEGSISASKLSFTTKSTEYKDGYRLAKTGDSGYSSSTYLEVEEEGMSISDYIYLEDITGTWYLSNVSRLAFFREDKTFISYLYDSKNTNTMPPSSVDLVASFPVFSETKYIKICCETSKKSDVEVIIQDVNVGKYNFEIPKLTLTNKQINECASNFKENSIDVSKIKQIKSVSSPSLNLFNKNNMIVGSWKEVGIENEEGVGIGTQIVFDPAYKCSTGFIECKPNTVYTKTGVAHNGEVSSCPPIYMFDENYEPISMIRTLGTFTTPSNARYMSGYLDTSEVNYREYPLGWHPDNYMIVEGNTLPLEYQEYSPYNYHFNGLKIDASCISNIEDYFTPNILKGIEKLESNTNYFENKNIIDSKKFIPSGFTGETTADVNYFISDFIPVDGTNNITLKSYGRLLAYNSEKTGINAWGGYSENETSESTINFNNAEVVYIRVCLRKESYDKNYYINQNGVNLIQVGGRYSFRDLTLSEDNLSDDLIVYLDNKIKEKAETKQENFKNNKDTNIVFKKNVDFNSTHFRIPFMCVTNLGTIIAGCDIRYNTWNDHSLIDIGTARSEDGGKTWIDKTVAIPNPGISSTLSRTMDGTILATREGRVFLIGNKFNDGSTGWTNVNTPNDPNWDCVLYHSDDDGRTWQFNQSLKHLLPAGQISFLGGVGSGIQMKDGTLVFPIQMARANDNPFNCQSGIIYSTDNGETWTMGETLVNEYTSECSVVEYPTGTIMINCRQEGQNHRSVFKTTNLGTTWEETPMNSNTQQTNACQGHMCKIKVGFDKEVILFTNPINDGTNREDGAYSGYDRSNLSLSILQNDTKFTPIHTLYRPHSDGYSCMAFDERRNRLYVVMELEYNLVFKDITGLLPTIQMYKNLEV